MMVRIDLDDPEEILGFSYMNNNGDIEYVSIVYDGSTCEISGVESDDSFEVFTKDIPKLIKALKAAYEHVTKEKL